MNQLLQSVTKFIQTILEAYSLPHELTADLLTLNTYLKAYDQNQDSLSDFVQRVAKRLEPNLKPSKSTQHIQKI